MHVRRRNSYITKNPSVYLQRIKGTQLTQEQKDIEIRKPLETEIPFMRLCASARRPSYNTPGSAGLDLFAPHDAIVEPGGQECLPLGVAVRMPPDTYLRLSTPSSPISLNLEVSSGVVDPDHRGEILAIVYNWEFKPIFIKEGTPIAQGIITPFIFKLPVEVDYLDPRPRREGAEKPKQQQPSCNFNDELLVYSSEDSEIKEIVEKWTARRSPPKFVGPDGPLLTAVVQKEAAEARLRAETVVRCYELEEANKVWEELGMKFANLDLAQEKGEAIALAIKEARKEDP